MCVMIMQSKPRLNLAKLKDDDDDITGGYILEYRHGDNFKDEPTINSTMCVIAYNSASSEGALDMLPGSACMQICSIYKTSCCLSGCFQYVVQFCGHMLLCTACLSHSKLEAASIPCFHMLHCGDCCGTSFDV